MIEIQSLSKTYLVHRKGSGLRGSIKSLFRRRWEQRHALTDVNLHLAEGEIIGLIGGNGAGKTTLIKLLSGIVHPTSGRATVLGHVPWEKTDAFKRRISVVMGQKAQLWWDLPASDCFTVLRNIYSIPRDRYRAHLKDLVERLGVGHLLNIQVRRLSLGERMKMEFIASLLHEPSVLFLDEPTLGLDFDAQNNIREFITEYRRTHRCAIVLTSHYMEDIERLCERIAVLRDGRIVYDGPLSHIKSQLIAERLIRIRLDERSRARTKQVKLPHGAHFDPLPNDGFVVKTSADKTPALVSFLISHFTVTDLTIETADLASAVGALLQKGRA